MDNFPLSLLLLKVNFSLSADALKLVTAKTPVRAIPTTEITMSFHINQFHIHNFAPNFPLTLSFWGPNFPLDTQARLQLWDAGTHLPESRRRAASDRVRVGFPELSGFLRVARAHSARDEDASSVRHQQSHGHQPGSECPGR